jgi:ABC-type lipoprotein export system ATPase subunit
VTAQELSGSALRVKRGGRWIVDGVDVVARAGSICGVTGPSGSGKTTLLFVLGALIAPDEGRVLLDDVPVATLEREYRSRCAMVFQTYGLAHSLTAAENIAVPLQSLGLERADVARRTEDVISAIGLDGLGHHLVEELSGGQQQRVAVARALAMRPDVILADEPTAELDAETRKLVLDLFLGYVSRGGIVVLSTHDPDVMSICDAVVELLDGRVTSTRQADGRGPTRELAAATGERAAGDKDDSSARELAAALSERADGGSDEDDEWLFRRPTADVNGDDRDDLDSADEVAVAADTAARAVAVGTAKQGMPSGPARPAAKRRKSVLVALALCGGLVVAGAATYGLVSTVGSGGGSAVGGTLPEETPLSNSLILADGESLAFRRVVVTIQGQQTTAPKATVVGPQLVAVDAATGAQTAIGAVRTPGGEAALEPALQAPMAAALTDGSAALIAIPKSHRAGESATAVLVTPGSTAVRDLGIANSVFRGSVPASAWLVSTGANRCSVSEVATDGRVLVGAKALPCDWRVTGSVTDGLVVLEASTRQGTPSLHLWDPATGRDTLLSSVTADEYVSVAGGDALYLLEQRSADTSTFAFDSAAGSSLTVTLDASAPMNFLQPAGDTFALSPDGDLIAVEELPFYMQPTGDTGNPSARRCAFLQCTEQVSGVVALYDATSGRLVGEHHLDYLIGAGPPVWSPDGAYVFVPSTPRAIEAVPMWSMHAPVTTYPLNKHINSIAFGSMQFTVLQRVSGVAQHG